VRQRLLDNVLPDRAALEEALTNHELELRKANAHVEALAGALAETERFAADMQAQLQVIADSVTWRLRSWVLRIPGLRAVARVLARPAAPATAGRRDRDRTPEP